MRHQTQLVTTFRLLYTSNPFRCSQVKLAPPSLHPSEAWLFGTELPLVLGSVLVHVVIVLATVPRTVVALHVKDQSSPNESVQGGCSQVETRQDVVPWSIHRESGPGRDESAARKRDNWLRQSRCNIYDYLEAHQFPNMATKPMAAALELSLCSREYVNIPTLAHTTSLANLRPRYQTPRPA
jgi:hypothetical protein